MSWMANAVGGGGKITGGYWDRWHVCGHMSDSKMAGSICYRIHYVHYMEVTSGAQKVEANNSHLIEPLGHFVEEDIAAW